MSPEDVLVLAKNSIVIVFYLSMPIITAATVVGLLVALVQTLTQLQEQTLAFAAKLTAIVVMIGFSGTWMADQLLTFLRQMLMRVIAL